jgi:hypothetical protein
MHGHYCSILEDIIRNNISIHSNAGTSSLPHIYPAIATLKLVNHA